MLLNASRCCFLKCTINKQVVTQTQPKKPAIMYISAKPTYIFFFRSTQKPIQECFVKSNSEGLRLCALLFKESKKVSIRRSNENQLNFAFCRRRKNTNCFKAFSFKINLVYEKYRSMYIYIVCRFFHIKHLSTLGWFDACLNRYLFG